MVPVRVKFFFFFLTLTRCGSASHFLAPFRTLPNGRFGHRGPSWVCLGVPRTPAPRPATDRCPLAGAAIFPPLARPQPPPAGTRERGPHLSSQSLHFTCNGTSCRKRTWLMSNRCPGGCAEKSNRPGGRDWPERCTDPAKV